MRSIRFVSPLLALALTAGAGAALAQGYPQQGPPPQGPPPGYQQPGYQQPGYPQQGPPPGYAQGPGGWDAPPPEYQDEFTRRGFHDGIEGARKDYENHRPPSPQNRDEFRHPGFIPPPYRHEYREAFRRGYVMAVRHFQGGPGPYGPPR